MIERKDGTVTTPDEARDILQKFGKIKSCLPVSPFERNALMLNEGGVLVSFQMYDMGQAAMQVRVPLLIFLHSADMIKALRHHDEYMMQNVQGVGSPLKSFQERTSVSTPFKAYLDRVELDNRSIFTGNLPSTVTEDDIKELFGSYGTIEKITIRDSFSKYECK